MNPALTDAIKEAYAIAPTTKVIIETLEIRQAGMDSIYLAQSRTGITARDENGDEHFFEPSGFQMSLPPSNEEGFQSLDIAIDNIGRRVSDFVQAASEVESVVEVVYRPYLSDDLSQPQMDPPLLLYLKDVKITAAQCTGRATFMDLVNKKFPSELYTRDRFPNLG